MRGAALVERETMLPRLLRLARTVFSVPTRCSSSDCERVFSTARKCIEDRRTGIKSSTVNAVLLLHNAL